MNRYVISQIIEAIGGGFYISQGFAKNKRTTFILTIFECGITTIGNFVQGTIAGGISVLFALVRSIFGALNINGLVFNVIYSASLILIGIFTNKSIMDWVPMIANIQITFGMAKGFKIGNFNEEVTSKLMWLINCILWWIYEITNMQLAWIIISLVAIVSGTITLIKLCNHKKTINEENK